MLDGKSTVYVNKQREQAQLHLEADYIVIVSVEERALKRAPRKRCFCAFVRSE